MRGSSPLLSPRKSRGRPMIRLDDDTPVHFSYFAASVRRRQRLGYVKCEQCGREFAETVPGKPYAHKCISPKDRRACMGEPTQFGGRLTSRQGPLRR